MNNLPFAQIFAFSGLLTIPFWLLLIIAPHWRVTRRLADSPLLAAPAALLYAALVLPNLGSVFAAVSQPTLEGISALLATPYGSTVAWVHFLAFDLLVGRWIYMDSRARGITAWLSGPILFATLMVGPVGFLAHLAARASLGRSTSAAAAAR